VFKWKSLLLGLLLALCPVIAHAAATNVGVWVSANCSTDTRLTNPDTVKTACYDGTLKQWLYWTGAAWAATNPNTAASGGTGINTSASTGMPRIDAGTWSVEGLYLYERAVCTTVAAPIANTSFCFDTTAGVLKVWSGAAWVSPGGSAALCSNADHYASINAAVAAIGATKTTLCVSNAQTLTADLTVPSTLSLWVLQGGTVTVPTGMTFTINGSFEAGLYQVFAWAGTGKVVFGSGSTEKVYPEWWGATGATNDAAAINAAIGSTALKVLFTRTGYPISSPIYVPAGVHGQTFEGLQQEGAHIYPTAADIKDGITNINALFINLNGTGNNTYRNLRFGGGGIGFTGTGIYGVEGGGTQALVATNIEDCWFSVGAIATSIKASMGDVTISNCLFEYSGRAIWLSGSVGNDIKIDNCIYGPVYGSFFYVDSTEAMNIVINNINGYNVQGGYLVETTTAISGLAISNVVVRSGADVGHAVGLVKLASAVGFTLTNFHLSQLAGSLGSLEGAYIDSSEVKISNGYVKGVTGSTLIPYDITIIGAGNKVEVSNVDFDGGLMALGLGKGGAVSGDIFIKNITATKTTSSTIGFWGTISANIEISDSSLLNAEYNVGTTTVSIIAMNTSGKLYIVNNTIGIDDVLATPAGRFKFTGSGQLIMGGNRLIGTLTEFQGGSTQVATFNGINVGGTSYRSGAGAPTGAVVPFFIGEMYLNTTGNHWYMSHGLTNADWTALN